MYYVCSENKGDDQLRGYLAAGLHLLAYGEKKVFS